MEESDIDQDGRYLMAIGVDSFRDLLKGNIDIIEYLNSGPGSVGGGSSENIYDDDSRTSLLSKMEVNALLLGGNANNMQHQQQQQHHLQQQQQQQLQQQQLQQNGQLHLPPPPPRLHHHAAPAPILHSTTAGLGRPGASAAPVFAAQHAGHHRNSQENQSYDQHAVRLPESPPETDSGAGSAGSPSGSEASPYSPEFQQQFHHLHRRPSQQMAHHHTGPGGHLQGSVIHPPVGALQAQQQAGGSGQSSEAAPQHCRPSSDVILNVHGLDHLTQSVVTDYLPVQTNARVPNHMNGRWGSTNATDYFSVVTAPGQSASNALGNENMASSSRSLAAQQQTSPTSVTPTTTTPNPNYSPYVLPSLQSSSYASEGQLHRKRARTENGVNVKPEPNSPSGRASEESLYYDESFSGHQQAIRFSEFQKDQWFALCNSNGREMQALGFAVVADKGFNYSHFDTAFVNQKKNHFQVSVHIEVRDPLPPKFVRVSTDNGVSLKPISEFQLDFYGVKAELLSSYVTIKQSQTDRKPIGYEAVKLDLPPNRVTKVTVARLHFSETTMNNQRKNGRPNPDQKYFYLVASLNALVQGNEKYTIAAYSSERVIVRASNPGQFDNGDSEVHWQKGQSPGSIYHPGPVGVGTDKPTTALSVTGDISCTGTVYHPSDARLKQNIQELNCAEALSKLSQIRVVQYDIRPEVAEQWGLSDEERRRIGVIAQELEDVMPDAVRENGEYLTVDDNRIFYESAAAVKELCRLTGNLEYKIEEVEKISKKLSRLSYLRRLGSLRSTESVSTCNGSKPPGSICEGSYFSCSRSSVANDTPPARRREDSPTKRCKKDAEEEEKCTGSHKPKHRHHHHHHHHQCVCRRFSLGDRRGPCGNKVIQSTIIILVVVMAFCLLSMATLYILDWHKRNASPAASSVASVGVHQQQQASSGSGGGKGGGVGLMQVGATNRPAHGKTPPPPPWPLHQPPYKQPKPLHSSCVKLPCVEFCCPNSYTYYVIGTNGDESGDPNSNTNEQKVEVVVAADQRHDIPLWNLPPVGTSFQNRFLNIVGMKRNGLWRRDQAATHGDTEGGRPDNRIQKRFAKLDYVSSMFGHPQTAYGNRWQAYGAPAVIRIPSLNETIDSRYCLENTCNDAKRGNFTYYVPVSKYMPRIPLEIEIKIERTQLVQYCQKWTGEYCYGVEEAYSDSVNSENNSVPKMDVVSEVHPRSVGKWELPVGVYQTSGYRFRVGTTTTLCSLPDDEAGASFVEYNIHFFRTCL